MIRNLLILLTITISSWSIAQDTNDGIVMLELFTSQGCSSCPPADELLEQIKKEHKNNKVFVLSYHVDYWNRLGWKDPFSSELYSDYQRDYAYQFHSRSIYTPQLVVNGSEHFTGSNASKARLAITTYANTKTTNTISLGAIKRKKKTLEIPFTTKGTKFNRINFVLIVSKRVTKVGRGENRNRTLTNSNIVASRLVQKKTEGAALISIPDWISIDDELSVIAYTQDTQLKVTGATELSL